MKNEGKKTEIPLNELLELKQSKGYLEKILDNSMDIIVITDSVGNIIRANKYFTELLAYKQDEVIGKHISEFGPIRNKTYNCTTGKSFQVTEQYFINRRKMYERFMEKQKTVNWQAYLVSKKDILIPVEHNLSFFYDEKANVLGAIGIIRDITERKRVTDELKEAKDYLENIIERSLDPIVVTDESGYLTRTNNAFLKLLGFSRAEVIGKHMSEFSPMSEGTYECTTGEMIQINEEFANDVTSTMISFQEIGEMVNAMSYYLRKDKKIVPIEDNMISLFDKEGKRSGAVAITRDITERKKAEIEIQKTKEYLENIFMTSVDGVIVGDSEGKVAGINKAVEKIFGCASDELVGKHTSEMVFFEEEHQMSGKELMDKLFSEGTISGVERTLKKLDGTAVVVEMNIALLKDGKGNMTGSVASIRDITERKKAEEIIKKSEEKYYNLIEHANDAIVSVNSAGMIIGFNKKAEEIFGYSREEVVGKSSYMFIPHQNEEIYTRALKQFANTGTGLEKSDNVVEGKAVKKDGTTFQVEYSYYAIDMEGEYIATAIIRDISKRKEAEQIILNHQKKLKTLTTELLLTEQRERQYFADFLHDEIGQQLFATRLQLELLKSSVSSVENTKTLDNALNTLYQVMNQSRTLTTELSSPILKQLGLEKALEWLAEETHKKYDILVTFEDDKQKKPLDDNMKLLLYQAVSELLTNVAKHAQTKNASVSIKKYNSSVRICVEDNGVGFHPPTDKSSDASLEGIGLFRIKERLEPLGGQIEIESQPNRGTKMTLVAPLGSNLVEQRI